MDRKIRIEQAISSSSETGTALYDFRGGTYIPPIVMIPINLPIYRMGNCRTFTAQQSEIAIKERDSNFFNNGQERNDAQEIQHKILFQLAEKKTSSVSAITEILDTEGQREELLITSSGIVVNGNRRLAAMRELYAAKDPKDMRFAYVRCAVLPSDVTKDEVDDIEANLQARPNTKLDYDWIGEAQLIKRQINKGRTSKEVAAQLRRSKTEIEGLLLSLAEADLYLKDWAETPGQYERISEDAEQLFGDLPKKLANKNASLQEASRVIAWSLYDNRDKLSGRLYAYNEVFGKLAPQVLDMTAEQIEAEGFFEEKKETDEILLAIDGESETDNHATVVEALKNKKTRKDTVIYLIDSCESAIEMEKGHKSEREALRLISQAHSKLVSIDINTAGEKTLPAIQKQMKAIQTILQKMETELTARISSKEKDIK